MNNAAAAKNNYPHPRNVVNFLAYLECNVCFITPRPETLTSSQVKTLVCALVPAEARYGATVCTDCVGK